MQRLGILLIAAFVLVAPAAQGDRGFAQRRPRRRYRAGEGAARSRRTILTSMRRKTYSPLMFAAGNGHVEMTRLLLARGATVDHRDHNGDRALLWAARARSCRDRADVARGGSRGAVGRRSLSAHAADARPRATRRVDVVRVLLASRRRCAATATTPTTRRCMQAAISGNAEIIAMLLAAGADPNRQSYSAPNHASASRRRPMAGLMPSGCWRRAGADLNARDHRRQDAALDSRPRAATRPCSMTLLAAGADHDARDDKDVSPFLAAIGEERGGRMAACRAHRATSIAVSRPRSGAAMPIWRGGSRSAAPM